MFPSESLVTPGLTVGSYPLHSLFVFGVRHRSKFIFFVCLCSVPTSLVENTILFPAMSGLDTLLVAQGCHKGQQAPWSLSWVCPAPAQDCRLLYVPPVPRGKRTLPGPARPCPPASRLWPHCMTLFNYKVTQ